LSHATFRERVALSHCNRDLREDIQQRTKMRIRRQLAEHLDTSIDSFWAVWSTTNSGLIGSYALWSLLNEPTWIPRDINLLTVPTSLTSWLTWASSEGFSAHTIPASGPGADHISAVWCFERQQVCTPFLFVLPKHSADMLSRTQGPYITLTLPYDEFVFPLIIARPTTLDTTIIFPYHIVSLYPRSSGAYIGVPLQDITPEDAELYRTRGFDLVQSAQRSPTYPCDELCKSRWRTLHDEWGFGSFNWGGLANDGTLPPEVQYPYPFTYTDIYKYRWTIGGTCLNTNCGYYNYPFSTLHRVSPCITM
jgi:hypothetical protein